MSNERIPEPSRTSLIVAIAFSLGALFVFYAQDYEAELMVCYPKSYTDIAPALPQAQDTYEQATPLPHAIKLGHRVEQPCKRRARSFRF